MSERILHLAVINGPNLNLLGLREPDIYGTVTLSDINSRLTAQAQALNTEISFIQSNHEGVLVDEIQKLQADGILINPAVFTHTSVAMRDALLIKKIPLIEVHLSNPQSREPFRHHSYFSDIALATICGFGNRGYDYALEHLITYLRRGL